MQDSQLHLDTALLQEQLGYRFVNPLLLQQALTHRSHSSLHNERLEFLGDSILNCVVAHMLYERFGKIDEGDLSRLRANLVKQQSLYEIAQRIELSAFLRLGEGELKSGGFRRPSILADTMEALFGAIFVDAGFEQARKVIADLYKPVLQSVDPKTLGKDAKTLLQEYLQSRYIALPQYNVVATHGAAHNQEFEVECVVPKLNVQVIGKGGSRRAAEQGAAKLALEAVLQLAPQAAKTGRKRKTTEIKTAKNEIKADGVNGENQEAIVSDSLTPTKPAKKQGPLENSVQSKLIPEIEANSVDNSVDATDKNSNQSVNNATSEASKDVSKEPSKELASSSPQKNKTAAAV